MNMRERSKEILDVKSRSSQSHVYITFRLKLLIERWEEAKKNGRYEANHLHRETDFYIIRAVTCLEVFTRGQIAELVDHGRRYTDRAVDLSKNFKMDFALVRDVQGRAITLGDIISHSGPINRFGQIIEYFEILLGKPLLPLIANAVDRWQVEVMRQPSEPIVTDIDDLARCMSRLFEIRHIVCHEIPSDPVYAVSEIRSLLDYALQFCNALQEVLQFEKFGLTPLTQTEMNVFAHESLAATEEKLAGLLSVMRDKLGASAVAVPGLAGRSTETRTECLDDAQEKWLAYRNAHCEFTAYSSRGGTIWPLLWSTQANRLTESRIADLEFWIAREYPVPKNPA